MTAIVGILNKKGIAIAADSAITFTDANNEVYKNQEGEKVIISQDKIINSGDKMLRLKDKQPISVMIVGNANMMYYPWDVIVRWYRKQKDSSSLPHFHDYVDDFMDFINKEVLKVNQTYQQPKNTFLVFAGYGDEDPYPSICQCVVTGIQKGKIQYTEPYNVCTISDEKESRIFVDGQADIIGAIGFGIQDERINDICDCLPNLMRNFILKQGLIDLFDNKINNQAIKQEAKEIIVESRNKHFQQLLNIIKGYNLQEMACLAENLIKATELHRKITFQPEGVGGLVDLAIITKNDGFQWLNRKSWYEPSKGGQYGKFGI